MEALRTPAQSHGAPPTASLSSKTFNPELLSLVFQPTTCTLKSLHIEVTVKQLAYVVGKALSEKSLEFLKHIANFEPAETDTPAFCGKGQIQAIQIDI